MPNVRFGVQTGQQETTWPQLRDAWLELEELGFDDLWVYDHYLPTGTTLEDGDVTDAWSLLAALSQVVKRPRLGTLVTSATFRHPAALAKTRPLLYYRRAPSVAFSFRNVALFGQDFLGEYHHAQR